jgi:hypothetical protein
VRSILFLSILFILPVHAQEADDSSQSAQPVSEAGPGPGKNLPPNSKEVPTPDFKGLIEAATSVANGLRQQTDDLAVFLAILAIIWTGYHAQFRGLEEFVGTLLRIAIAFALIAHFKEFTYATLTARDDLLASISLDGVQLTGQIGILIGSVGVGTLLMGPVGIGIAVLIFLTLGIILFIYSAQILFEAVLICFAPMAFACIAFKPAFGIFAGWLRTLIAVMLIPVGWALAFKIGQNLFTLEGDHKFQDVIAALIYTMMTAAIYVGMPGITIWIINRTADSTGTVLSSGMSNLTSLISGNLATRSAGMAGTPAGSPTLGQRLSNVAIPSGGNSASSTTTQATNPVTQRVMEAFRWQKTTQPTTKP